MEGKEEKRSITNYCYVSTRKDGGAVIVKPYGYGGGNVCLENVGGYAKPGTYTDKISGNEFTITETEIRGQVGETGIAVLYDGFFSYGSGNYDEFERMDDANLVFSSSYEFPHGDADVNVTSSSVKHYYGSSMTVGGSTTDADDYMIGQVKKYTSDTVAAAYQRLISMDMPYEQKMKAITAFFQNYGITDVQEGTRYLTYTSRHRRNYLMLTDDDNYMACQFARWLKSKDGTKARAALYADGLLLNKEVFD